MKKYTKVEAINAAKEFIEKVNALEKEYGLVFNSDTGDVYLTYKSKDKDVYWDEIDLGWYGDGTGIKVTHVLKDKDYYKKQALSKLSEEEKEALGL